MQQRIAVLAIGGVVVAFTVVFVSFVDAVTVTVDATLGKHTLSQTTPLIVFVRRASVRSLQFKVRTAVQCR
jgi:hypothetical protein